MSKMKANAPWSISFDPKRVTGPSDRFNPTCLFAQARLAHHWAIQTRPMSALPAHHPPSPVDRGSSGLSWSSTQQRGVTGPASPLVHGV
ncbi:hypothetical protein V6N12_024512 [Hibiscus sabdariffa]|uniref:Uncharacterized protein n=1 Tax=Hibiscus sabdariffa TaxID=183260 RepID=A0ABR2G1H2_9ROSI